MNVLVLGGNGFIGAPLVDRLLEDGHFVRIVDHNDLPTRKDNGRWEFIKGNYEDVVAEALEDIDLVYHLADSVPPKKPSNGKLINKLLKEMIKKKIKRIVYFSSGGTVYGNLKKNPISEKEDVCPMSEYGKQKVAAERCLIRYQLKGIEPLILRPANVYGANGRHGLIATLFQNLKNKQDSEIWGNGENRRDYIYINDVIDFAIMAGFSNKSGIYNVGSGKGISVKEIIKLIEKITKMELSIKYLKNKKNEIENIILDIDKAKECFNWKPKVLIEKGLKKCRKN